MGIQRSCGHIDYAYNPECLGCVKWERDQVAEKLESARRMIAEQVAQIKAAELQVGEAKERYAKVVESFDTFYWSDEQRNVVRIIAEAIRTGQPSSNWERSDITEKRNGLDGIKMNNDPEWLKKMAALENNDDCTAGVPDSKYCDLTNPDCATHGGKKASCGEPLPCKYHSECETCGHGGLGHTNGFGCRWYGCGCTQMKVKAI